MPRFDTPMEYAFAKEAAASLGQSGKQLRAALEALVRYDGDVAAGRIRVQAERRARLVGQAGEAFWRYVVQRELLGLVDADYIAREYGVPAEVRACMGPASARRDQAD